MSGVIAIGQRLRLLRKAKGLTLAEASVDIGISRSHLTNIENGKDKASLDTLKALSDFYSTSLDVLYGSSPEGGADPETARLLRTVGARIYAVRLALSEQHKTLAALSVAAGTTEEVVASWEAGTSFPNLRHLVSLRLTLGIGSDWVLSGDFRALPEVVVQRMVNQGTAADAPEASRELRQALRVDSDDRPGRTLHERQAGYPPRTLGSID